jgi:MFS family permease
MTTPAPAKTSPPRRTASGLRGFPAAALRALLTAGPLADRGFRLLNIGQASSTVGDFCYAVALPWMVLSAGGRDKAALLGLVLACYGIPRTVLIPVGGVLADKIGARRVMIGADVARCVLVGVFAYLAVRHEVSIATLGPVAALIGAGEGLFLPAFFTITPKLLPADQLQAGNAISAALNQAGSLAGPVLGGLLVVNWGPAGAFGVDAATFAISAVTLFLIGTRTLATIQATGEAADGQPATSAKTGMLRLLREPVLYTLMTVSLVVNLVAAGTFEVAMPDLAHIRFGPAGYSALLVGFGAGALVGTVVAGRSTSLRKPAVTSCYLLGAAAAAIGLLPYLGGLPGAVAAAVALGGCTAFGNIIIITLLQQWAPAEMLGRVMSLMMLASIGSFPLSVAVAGWLVTRLSSPAPFFPAAAIVLAITMLAALSKQEIRTLGARQAGGEPRPAEDAAAVQSSPA